jgi:heat shock protein HslJ
MKSTMIRSATLAVFLAAAVLGGTLLSGCSDSNDPSSSLFSIWQLQEFVLDDGTTTPVDDPSKYTVDLRTDFTASIRSDCNNCNGSFTADDKNLSFGTMACTLAACEPGSFDTQFQMALATVSSYDMDPALFLYHEGGVMRLTPVPTLF